MTSLPSLDAFEGYEFESLLAKVNESFPSIVGAIRLITLRIPSFLGAGMHEVLNDRRDLWESGGEYLLRDRECRNGDRRSAKR